MAARNELSPPAGVVYWNGFNRDALKPARGFTREAVKSMFETTDKGTLVRTVNSDGLYIGDEIILITGIRIWRFAGRPDSVRWVNARSLDNTEKGLRISLTKPELELHPYTSVTVVGYIDESDPKNKDFYKPLDTSAPSADLV
jgi:hypothetical protein